MSITEKNIMAVNVGLTVGVSAVVLFLIPQLGLHHPQNWVNWISADNSWLVMLVISVLLMVLCALTPLPAEALSLANGIVFGPWAGALVTWVSAMLGALLGLLWGKKMVGRVRLRMEQNEAWHKVNDMIKRWGPIGFLSARLFPAVPFFVLNIGAALLPISLRKYLLITGVAIIPHILLISFVGDQIAKMV